MPASSAAPVLHLRWVWGLALWSALLGVCGATAGDAPAPPPAVSQAIPDARLAGAGVLRFWGFHIYDAQLWVGSKGYRPDHPADAPFALDVRYARHFTGKAIASTSLDEFERLGAGTEEQRQRWYQELLHLLPDVDAGQHLTGLFQPGEGVTLFSDGALLGTVRDVDFARAFFEIWLDPRTKAPDLREKLLADAAPRQ